MRFQLALGNFSQMSGDYLITLEKILTELSKSDTQVFIDIQNDQHNDKIDGYIQRLQDQGFFKDIASDSVDISRSGQNGQVLKNCVVKCQPEQQQILLQSKDAYNKLVNCITNTFQVDGDPIISSINTQSLRIQVNYENINDVKKKVDDFIKSLQFTYLQQNQYNLDKYLKVFQKSDIYVLRGNQNQVKKPQPLKGYKQNVEEAEQCLLYGFNDKVRQIQNIVEQTTKIGFFNIYESLYLQQTLERMQLCYIYGESLNNGELLLIGPYVEVKEQEDLIRKELKSFRLKLNTELKNKLTEQEFNTLNLNQFINSQAELQVDENNQQFFTYMCCIYIEIDDGRIINDIFYCSSDKRDIHNSMQEFIMDEAERVLDQPGIRNALLFLLLTNSQSQEEQMMKEFRQNSTLEIQKIYDPKITDFFQLQDLEYGGSLEEENEVIVEFNNKVLTIKGKLDKVNKTVNSIKLYYESQQEDVNYFDFESDLHLRIIDKYYDEKFKSIFEINYCKYKKKKLERRLEIKGGIRNVTQVIKELTTLDKKIGNDLLEIQEQIDRKEMQRDVYKKIIEDIQNKTATQIIEGESENQHMICYLEYQCDKIQIKLSQGNPILSIKDSKDHQKYQNSTIVIPIQRGSTYKRTWESDLMQMVQVDSQYLIKQYGIQYKIVDNSEAPKSKNQLKKQPKKEPIIIALKVLNIFHQDETQYINYFDKETVERGFEQGFQQMFNDALSENGSKKFIISMIDDERLDLQIIKIFQKVLDSNKRDKKIQFEFLVHSLDNLYTLANLFNKAGLQRKEHTQQIHSIQNITIRGLYEEDLNEALEELRQKC